MIISKCYKCYILKSHQQNWTEWQMRTRSKERVYSGTPHEGCWVCPEYLPSIQVCSVIAALVSFHWHPYAPQHPPPIFLIFQMSSMHHVTFLDSFNTRMAATTFLGFPCSLCLLCLVVVHCILSSLLISLFLGRDHTTAVCSNFRWIKATHFCHHLSVHVTMWHS